MHALFEQLLPRRLLSVSLPQGFVITPLVSGLVAPTAEAVAPDGRIFVAEQGGDVRVIDNGQLQSVPFAHVHVNSSGELGMMGITLDPNFQSDGYVYVYCTVGGAAPFNRIERFTADGDVAAPGSATTILNLDALDPTSQFDDGGALHFGPDGKLYIATGDDDDPNNSQSLSNLEGKILRVNPDGSIPTDNPFYTRAHGRNRLIWAYGLRNPYNFSFDAASGRMFINDVGSDLFEEVDQGAPAANFGWPLEEGFGTMPGLTNPVFAYPHPQGFAITGSAFFPTAARVPAKYSGQYLFADLFGPSEDGSKSVAWIHMLNPQTDTEQSFASGLKLPIGLAFGGDGSLYVLSRGTGPDADAQDATGSISVIRYVANRPPAIDTQPVAQTVANGAATSFGVTAVGSGTLQYQWLRNGSAIAGATSATLTIPAARLVDNDAQYSVRISSAAGTTTSDAALLKVVDAAAPRVKILLPAASTLFAGGQAIDFAAAAVDGTDGVLHGRALSWQARYETGSVLQPFASGIFGASGQFKTATDPPQTQAGIAATDVAYVVSVTATDSLGLSTTVTRTILPRVVQMTVTSNVQDLQLTFNGNDAPSPQTAEVVVGVDQSLEAASEQAVGGKAYRFERWSDGLAASHSVRAPSRDATFTADYSLES